MSIAVVITVSSDHVHYCKSLLASINYYNSELPIIILKDGVFQESFDKNKFNNITVVNSNDINKIHDLDLYILLNKLNILFLPDLGLEYDYYFHLDADSIVTNKIEINNNFDFQILQGSKLNYNEGNHKKWVNQYAFDPLDFPEYKFDLNNFYYFSASHIVISKKIIPYLKELLIEHRYEMNKHFLNDKRIKFNDQGFFNLAVNILSFSKKININAKNFGIYGKEKSTSYPLLTLDNVIGKKNTDVLFIHYTGPSRKMFLKNHNFGQILQFFSKKYYESNPLLYYLDNSRRILHSFMKKYKKKVLMKFKLLKKYIKR